MVSFVTEFPFVFYHTQTIYQFVDVASYVTYYPSSFLADFACIFIRLIDWGGYMDSQHL